MYTLQRFPLHLQYVNVFFLTIMYKLQSTKDTSTWLVVRISSATTPFNKVLTTNGAGKQ